MLGQKRLKEIRERLKGVLKNVAPESAEEYDISYGPSKEDTVSPLDPAYGLYLSPKSNPDMVFKILDIRESELIRPIPAHLERFYGGNAFADRVKQGIEELEKEKLRRGKPSKLETLGVISILSILVGVFLLSNNLIGFAISNLSQSSGNWIGIILLLTGILGSFFSLRAGKNK